MDNILLTPEEMEKQQELFEYEMTQVILNLKGKFKKYDASNSPIKQNEEFINALQDKELLFSPFIGDDIKVKYTMNVHDIQTSLDIKAIDSTFTGIDCTMPSIVNKADYAPYNMKTKTYISNVTINNVSTWNEYNHFHVENIDVSYESTLAHIDVKPYISMSDISVQKKDIHIKNNVLDCAYTQYHIENIPKVKTDLVIKKIKPEYSLFQISKSVNVDVKVNRKVASIEYEPIKQAKKQYTHNVPAVKYAPTEAKKIVVNVKNIEARKVELQKLKHDEYTKDISIQEYDVPQINANINVYMDSLQVPNFTSMVVPKQNGTIEFDFQNKYVQPTLLVEVPNTKLKINEVAKEIKTNIRPIDSLPEEVTQVKDFYAIWKDM